MCSATLTKPIREVACETEVFRIVICCQCDFIYVANPRSTSVSAGSEPAAIPSHRRYHLIKEVVLRLSQQDRKTSVLEVGCGWGGLASLLCNEHNIDYTGYEPSGIRASYCIKHHLNVIHDFLPSSQENFYDIAILDNILEHIYNPADLLKQVARAVKNDGIIIVIVPNLRDVRRFIPTWKKQHYWIPFSHINYFSFYDLKQLFHRFGIDIGHFPTPLMMKESPFYFILSLLNLLNIHILGHYIIGKKKIIKFTDISL